MIVYPWWVTAMAWAVGAHLALVVGALVLFVVTGGYHVGWLLLRRLGRVPK